MSSSDSEPELEEKSSEFTKDGDQDKDNYDSKLSKTNTEKDQEVSRFKYAKSIAFGVLVTGVVYFVLYLIISHNAKLQDDQAREETRGAKLLSNVATCGADSFMLRDSICDETTNTELCRYDGGDCCLEIKDTSLCRNCSCILDVNPDQLKQDFDDLLIKPVRKHTQLSDISHCIVTVQDVVSESVCAVLCLDHDMENSINTWRYHNNSKVCKCGWVDSMQCPESMVKASWELRKISSLQKYDTFIQLKKTIPCDCQARGWLVNGTRTVANQKDESSSVSIWHCQQRCHLDNDCFLFSWKLQDPNAGECLHFKDFSSTTEINVNQDWITSTAICTGFPKYFSSNLITMFLIKRLSNSLIPALTNNDGTVRFSCLGAQNVNVPDTVIVAINAINNPRLEVTKIDSENETVQACAHMLTLDENQDQDWSALGVLMDNEGGFSLVICKSYKTCFKLTDSGLESVGLLLETRIGSASIVINNGSSLWITGGHDYDLLYHKTTELFTLNSSSVYVTFMLPKSLAYHCLEKFNDQVAILIGGQNFDQGPEGTAWVWDFMTTNETWTEMPAKLTFPRYKHACGVLQDQADPGIKIIVAAGGLVASNSDILATETVEFLVVDEKNSIQESQWTIGPSMPMPAHDAASVTTSDQLKLFVIGGIKTDGYFEMSSTILEMKCTNLQCHWTNIGQLAQPASKELVLAFPTSPMIFGWEPDGAQVCPSSGIHIGPSIFHDNPEDSLLIVTSGYKYQGPESHGFQGLSLNETQVFAISKGGILSEVVTTGLDLAIELVEAKGALIKTSTDPLLFHPLICGGSYGLIRNPEYNEHCYSLTNSSQPVGGFVNHRGRAAFTVVNNGTALWIAGGGFITTELMDSLQNYQSSVSGHSFPNLVQDKFTHPCLVILDNNIAIVYSGQYKNQPQNHSWYIDLNDQDEGWIEIGQLKYERLGASCGVLKTDTTEIVVAAGGMAKGSSHHVTDSVEVLHVSNGNMSMVSWKLDSQAMPMALTFAATATNHDQTRLFLAGGETKSMNDGNPHCNIDDCQLQSIMSLTCPDKICQWTRHQEVELSFKISRAVAFIIPPFARISWVSYRKEGRTCPNT